MAYASSPTHPKRIAGYELLDRIGAGAASIIYRARRTSTGEIVAIKHVAVEGRENMKYLRHIRNEYRVLRSLQDAPGRSPHPGIVTAYALIGKGFMRRTKERALVMEYLEGLDLRRERRYPFAQIVDIMAQVAAALCFLHSRGIVHGDVKPENIVVSPVGRATLVDFGFSCRAGSQATSIRGTRDYMAPEQVDMGRITEKTDIYNFGASLYFLLTGRHVPALIPAQGDRSHFITSRKVNPAPPRSLNPVIPPALDGMVLRCVEKDPIVRPSCIEEVLDVLQATKADFGF